MNPITKIDFYLKKIIIKKTKIPPPERWYFKIKIVLFHNKKYKIIIIITIKHHLLQNVNNINLNFLYFLRTFYL